MISMYKRSIRYRNWAAVFLIALLGLAAIKSYYSWAKIELYARAVELQAGGHPVEAEEAFQKVLDNRFIDYKNRETAEALALLRPVTELKRSFAAMAGDVQAAVKVSDVPTLVSTYQQLQELKSAYASRDQGARKLLAETETQYPLEAAISDAFAVVKQNLVKSVESEAAKKTFDGDRAIAYLLQIPSVYYKDEKTKKQELNKLLEKYDHVRMDVWMNGKPFQEVLGEGTRLIQFYKTNELQTAWLLSKLETYIQGSLSKLLEKNDLKGFLTNVRLYQDNNELFSDKSKLNAYIQTSIQKQLSRAEQLTAARKFDEAIELYTILGGFRDTEKELRETELRAMEFDPIRLLRKAAGDDLDFSYVVSTKGKWGATLAAAGLAENKTLVFARLLPDRSIDKTEGPINQGMTVKSIQFSDQLSPQQLPVLLIEAVSKTRKARYAAYEIQSRNMRKILDIEADRYAIERPGLLTVDHPNADGAGDSAYYEYRDGQFVFSKNKTDYRDIIISQLPNNKTGKVRFQCSIISVEGGATIGQFNDDYVVLSGQQGLKLGPALVTGSYSGSEDIKINNLTVKAYKVSVSELTQ